MTVAGGRALSIYIGGAVRDHDQFIIGVILRGQRGQIFAQAGVAAFHGNDDGGRRQGFVHVRGRRFRKPSGYVCGALALTAEREESEDQRGAGEEPKPQHTLLAALGLGLGLRLGFGRRLRHGFRLLRLCLFSARGLFGRGLFGRGLFEQGLFGGGLLDRLFFGEDFVRRVFQERLWHDGADRATRRDFGQHFGEQGLLARVHFGRRRLLVPVVVIVVTCPAANFGGLARQQGYNRVVHDALALDAKVVDDVA